MNLDGRQMAILIVFSLGALLLIYKSADLQILDSSYKKLAEKTVLDKQTRYPSRGNIYDRNNELLTYNKPIYDLEMIYNNIDKDMDTTLFCELLEIDKSTFIENTNKNWKDKRFHKSIPTAFHSEIGPIQ